MPQIVNGVSLVLSDIVTCVTPLLFVVSSTVLLTCTTLQWVLDRCTGTWAPVLSRCTHMCQPKPVTMSFTSAIHVAGGCSTGIGWKSETSYGQLFADVAFSCWPTVGRLVYVAPRCSRRVVLGVHLRGPKYNSRGATSPDMTTFVTFWMRGCHCSIYTSSVIESVPSCACHLTLAARMHV